MLAVLRLTVLFISKSVDISKDNHTLRTSTLLRIHTHLRIGYSHTSKGIGYSHTSKGIGYSHTSKGIRYSHTYKGRLFPHM